MDDDGVGSIGYNIVAENTKYEEDMVLHRPPRGGVKKLPGQGMTRSPLRGCILR